MLGLLEHVLHVGGAGAHVFTGDVVAPEVFDQLAVSPKKLLPVDSFLFPSLAAEDDGFPAATRQAGQSVLIRHAASQAQGVRERFTLAPVMPVACAPDRRAERCAVDDHDSPVTRLDIASPDHAFISGHRLFTDIHFAASISRDRNTPRMAPTGSEILFFPLIEYSFARVDLRTSTLLV